MRSAAIALAAILLLAMLVIAAATSVITILPGGAGALVPTGQALAGVPPAYLMLYQQAAQRCPGLPWTVLAAIGEVESDHGRSTAPGVHSGANSAGAAGPTRSRPPPPTCARRSPAMTVILPARSSPTTTQTRTWSAS